MARFPQLQTEETVQLYDKTRLDGSRSFVSVDSASITTVEIEPEASNGYIDVTSNNYVLDWAYTTAGTKTVSIKVTTSEGNTVLTKTLTAISESDDKLFSKDSELVDLEPDILSYLPENRNSFLNVHRLAQDRILDILDSKKIWDTSGNRLDKTHVVDTKEVNDWSKFMAMRLIFESLSNDVGDIFHEKSDRYKQLENKAASRAAIKLDLDGDGVIESHETTQLFSGTMVRR